jgi:hypothetical protein
LCIVLEDFLKEKNSKYEYWKMEKKSFLKSSKVCTHLRLFYILYQEIHIKKEKRNKRKE